MVQVYAEPLSRRHFAGAASPAAALRGGLLVGSVVLSFLLAYATGGFWPKTAWELEQPLVHYSGDGLAVFEGAQAGDEQVWASSPALGASLGSKAAAASIQVGELDSNFDGKPDVIHFRARLPPGGPPVHSVKLLLQLTYALSGAARVKMHSLAYVAAASPLPGAALDVDGQLELRQAAPLHAFTLSSAYMAPLLRAQPSGDAGALEADGLLHLPLLLSAYGARNLTTVLAAPATVWTAVPAAGGAGFVLDVRIRVPSHQLLLYRPSLGAALKWGWVQFLAAFAAVWWLAARFEWAMFRLRVLGTRVVSDVAPRMHKFE